MHQKAPKALQDASQRQGYPRTPWDARRACGVLLEALIHFGRLADISRLGPLGTLGCPGKL